MLVGLRGVGKTVLLERLSGMRRRPTGIHTMRAEAPESRSLPAILAPQLRQSAAAALLEATRPATWPTARSADSRASQGALKVKFGDIEVGLDFERGTRAR